MVSRILLVWAVTAAATPSSGAESNRAESLREVAGIRGGLVVVNGCADPAFLAELNAAGSYLVHGLEENAQRVAMARAYLREKDLYGPVTVSPFRGGPLPYVDRLVQMIVVMADTQPAKEEMDRVLSPGGVIADMRVSPPQITRKPWPAELDEWTHYLYDASNNAVSKDREVSPPEGLRWTCGPKYARSHEHFASMSAMVTAGGRVFYIIDEGPISSVYLPPQWKLVARDAFSGVLLWKKPIANWESHLRGFRSGPPEIGRRLVATKDRIYVALGYGESVSVLDAVTGKQLKTFPGTRGARELLLTDGVLYVLADDMTLEQHEKRKAWINRINPTLEIWYRFPKEAFDMYGTPRVVAVDVATGKTRWKRDFKVPGEITPATMAVDGGKLCFQSLSHVVCLDAADGKERWKTKRPVATSRYSWSTPTLVVRDGVVLSVDRTETANVRGAAPRGSRWVMSSGNSEGHQDAEAFAFSLDDGKELWRMKCSENYNVPSDVLVLGDVAWIGNLRHGKDDGFTEGRDLTTGKVVATCPPQKAWGHHRCYRNKATERWLLIGRGGVQFLDPKTGKYRGSSATRGSCQYGVMPANGLLYVPHHSCACEPETMMAGLNVLSAQSSAPRSSSPKSDVAMQPALEKGPGYSAALNRAALPTSDWPTYRGDAARSGYRDLAAPLQPAVAWTTQLTAPITAPVAAAGLVFVAEKNRHALIALSAHDGQPAWTFTADGRIDSPPTLFGSRCVFGTRNGFVYCLRASNGEMMWKFRAAPSDRRLFAYEQLESVWPVHGSVLIDDKLSGGVPTVYFAAGRSSLVDGGIRLIAVDLETGAVRHRIDIRKNHGRGVIQRRAFPDVLSLEGDALWMRGLGVDAKLSPIERRPHLFAPRGFLDDTWWHRTYWIYGTEIGGGYTNWPLVGNVVPSGRLLVTDGGKFIYGYGRMAYRAGDGHVRPDMTQGYKLFAEVLHRRATPRPQPANLPKVKREIRWTAELPLVVRSLVLSRDALLLAGGKSAAETTKEHGPGTFWVASREDGAKVAACKLSAPPVLDGMAATAQGVYLAGIDGTVTCVRATRDK